MEKKWWKSKILWASVGDLIAILGGVVMGEIELGAGIATGITALIAIFRLFFTNTNLTT